MRHFLLIAASCMTIVSGAQDLAGNHALINEHFAAGRHAEVIDLVERQLALMPGTTWEDSLYKYVYPYGRALRMVRGPEQAVAGTRRLVELVERRGDPVHLVEALFDQSWTYYEMGHIKDCIRADSMAMVVADGSPAVPASLKGRTRQYLAFDYNYIGDYRAMAHYARAALEVYEQAGGIAPIQLSESYNALGAALWHLGRIREAEANYKQALAVLGADSSISGMMRRAATYGNLGIVWSDVGDLGRSKAYYHENLAIFDHLISRPDLGPGDRDEIIVARSRTYANLATLAYMAGDMGRTRTLLQMAWNDRSQVLDADDPRLLYLYDQMAEMEIAANELDKAEELAITYLNAVDRELGRHNDTYVQASIKWAGIAFRKKEYVRADSLFEGIIGPAGRTAGDGTDPNLLRALRGRAMVHAARDDHKRAQDDLLRARAIAERINGPAHYRVAELDLLLAEQAFAAGDHEGTLRRAEMALAMLQERIDALRRSKVPPQYPLPGLLPDAIYWKVRAGRALHPSARGSARWNEDLDLAVRSLMTSHRAIEDDDSKLLLVGAHDRLFDLALEDAFESYQQSGEEADIQRFFSLSEANRSILLKNRLSGFAGVSFAGVPDSVLAREQELRKSLVINPDNPDSQIGMDRREREYTALLYQLEQQYPRYFDLRYGDRTPSLKEVRERLLTDGSRLLAYTRTKEHLFAIVIGRKEARLIELVAPNLGEQVTRLNEALALRNTADYVEQAQAIHQAVFAPLGPLPDSGELLIIPDGELHAVNFELLLQGPVGRDFTKKLLIQRYTIGYLFSATTRLQFADLARQTEGILAIAPGFTDQLKRDYQARIPDSMLVDRRFLSYVRQPFAMRTAEGLGRAYGADVLTGGAASEGAFRERAPRHGLLFLGTHAEMDPAHPMYSRLVFSKDGDGRDPEQDGYLHAYELYELGLNAQLAVLTACESGGGPEVAGEGIRSLGAAFAYAGCTSMVVALWNIDEKISASIIEDFHRHLAEGMPKHAALRKAKLDYLSQAGDELLHPYYWAGLVLIGDTSPVDLKPAGRGPWPWVALVLGVAALAIGTRRVARSRAIRTG